MRDMLRRWEAKFREMYLQEMWTGPEPHECGLHRLGDGGAIMSDTCSTARLAKKQLAALIEVRVVEHLGSEVWKDMSLVEREAAARTHPQDCWQHLRNIILANMSRAQVLVSRFQPSVVSDHLSLIELSSSFRRPT